MISAQALPWSSGPPIVCDADGRFYLEVPAAGVYWLLFSGPAGEAETTLMSPVEVPPEEKTERLIALAAGRISGPVLAPDGAPVAHMRVGAGHEFLLRLPSFEDALGSEDARGTGYAWTDENGDYTLVVPVGMMEVGAPEAAPGEERDERPFLWDARPVVVGAGAHLTGVDLRHRSREARSWAT